jgi:transcriptional regulator with XRE-family HTH domain
MKGIGKRIEHIRLALGKTEQEVSDAVGMSIFEYRDLESYDDEIIDVLSIHTARKVSTYFSLSLLELLVPDKSAWPSNNIKPKVLSKMVVDKIKKLEISNETAEEKIGWFLEDFFSNPNACFKKYPIMFFIDVSKFLGIEWESTIPNKINR